VASGSTVNIHQSGFVSQVVGQAGFLNVYPVTTTGTYANVAHLTGTWSGITLNNTVGGGTQNQANVQNVRLFAGSISGTPAISANLWVGNAIALHTTVSWAGTGATSASTAQRRWVILNEDPYSIIETQGNVLITGSSNLQVTGNTQIRALQETVVVTGFTGGAWTANCAAGTIQKATLGSNITSLAFTNMPAGGSVTLIITQDATGGRTLTTTGIKYAGASSTLSTAANAIDMLNILFDGTNYYGSLVKGYA
jgi:hypothetical protein